MAQTYVDAAVGAYRLVANLLTRHCNEAFAQCQKNCKSSAPQAEYVEFYATKGYLGHKACAGTVMQNKAGYVIANYFKQKCMMVTCGPSALAGDHPYETMSVYIQPQARSVLNGEWCSAHAIVLPSE